MGEGHEASSPYFHEPFSHLVFLFGSACFCRSAIRKSPNNVTASDCPWCEAFEDEVGKGYPNTEEAKLLPLRRYDFYDPMPTDMVDLVPATMTPTFIVIKDGKEAGRIIGYPGHELFWWRLSEFTH